MNPLLQLLAAYIRVMRYEIDCEFTTDEVIENATVSLAAIGIDVPKNNDWWKNKDGDV